MRWQNERPIYVFHRHGIAPGERQIARFLNRHLIALNAIHMPARCALRLTCLDEQGINSEIDVRVCWHQSGIEFREVDKPPDGIRMRQCVGE